MTKYRATQIYGVYYDTETRNSDDTVGCCIITSDRDLVRVSGDRQVSFSIEYLKEAIKRLEKEGATAAVLSHHKIPEGAESQFTPLIMTDITNPDNSVMIAPRHTEPEVNIVVKIEDEKITKLCKALQDTRPTRLELELAIAEVGNKVVTDE